MWDSFVAILVKEMRHMFRDRTTLIFAFTLPVFQLVLFGFIDQTVRDLPTVVVDQDQTRFARELMDELRATKTFEVSSVTSSPEQARADIRAGRARVAIVIPPDFHDRRARGETAKFLILIDGSDSTVSQQALAAVNGLVLVQGTSGPPPLAAQPIILFNPEGRTANFIIPGLVAVLLQMAAMMLAAVAIVREREKGTLEQLLVTPIHPVGLILGKLAPYLALGIVEMTVILAIMRWGFAVPIQGSLLFLYGAAIIYLFALLSLGLFLSTRTTNQMQAQQLSMMFILPSIFLSGYIFPVSGLPAPLRWLGQLLPATHMIAIMRGAVLRHAGVIDLVPNILALGAISVVLVTLSVASFKKITA
jgi:ABC-2 type transport system permease protein